jgi:hypothetical protein
MSVETPSSMNAARPRKHGIVTERNVLLVDLSAATKVIDSGEETIDLLTHLVMVANDEDLLTLECLNEMGMTFVCHVSDDIGKIAFANTLVPKLDHFFVHPIHINCDRVVMIDVEILGRVIVGVVVEPTLSFAIERNTPVVEMRICDYMCFSHDIPVLSEDGKNVKEKGPNCKNNSTPFYGLFWRAYWNINEFLFAFDPSN